MKKEFIIILALFFILIPVLVWATNGHSISLNGTSQSLTITDVWSATTTSFTMEAWFRTDNYTKKEQTIITNGRGVIGTPTVGRGYSLVISGAGKTDGSLYLLDHYVIWNYTGVKITDSNWHHIALVLNSVGTAKVYLDGTAIYTKTGMLGIPNGGSAIGVEATNTRYLDGNVDEVVIWSEERNLAEIQASYNSGNGKEYIGNEENMLAYYRFENSVEDLTANNLDLTNNNSAAFSTDVPFITDTCSYYGSGDWYINSSDNCFIKTDVYVFGNVNLLNTGTGKLHIIDGATLSCENINSTSTDIDVEAGSKIKLWNDS